MIDPFADINRLLANPLAGTASRRAASGAAQLPELTDEEYESLLSQMGSGVMSGVGYVGGVLDKPRRAIAGLLSGNPRELLSIIPGSDTFGLTNREDAVYGKDLLGWDDPNSWWDDVAGFAADMALDPLTYLTFGGGAVAKGAGSLAKGAGLLDDAARLQTVAARKMGTELGEKALKKIGPRQAKLQTTLRDHIAHGGDDTLNALQDTAKAQGLDLAKYMDQPLAKPMGVGLPFSAPSKTFGGLKTAKTLDYIGDAVRHGKYSPVKHLAPLFEAGVSGARSRMGGLIGKTATWQATRGTARARDQFLTFLDKTLDDTGKSILKTADDENAFLRYVERGDPLPANLSGIQEAADYGKTALADLRRRMGEAGARNPALDDIIDYWPRAKNMSPSMREWTGKVLNGTDAHNLSRKDIFRGWDGGTAFLNELSVDPIVSGLLHRVPTSAPPQLSKGMVVRVNVGNKQLGTIKAIADDGTLTVTLPHANGAIDATLPPTQVEALTRTGMGANRTATLDELSDYVVGKWGLDDITAPEELHELVEHMIDLDVKHAKGTSLFGSPVEAFKRRMETGERAISVADSYSKFLPGVVRAPVKSHAAQTEMGLGGRVQDIAPPELGAKVTNLEDVVKKGGMTDEFLERLGREIGLKDDALPGFTSLKEGDEIFSNAYGAWGRVTNLDEAGRRVKIPIESQRPGGMAESDWIPFDQINVRHKAYNADDMTKLSAGQKAHAFNIPTEIAADLGKIQKTFSSPEEVGVLVAAYDKVLNLFKGSVTAAGPGTLSFNFRNLTSGQVMNFFAGASDPRYGRLNPMRYVQPVIDARRLATGKTIKDGKSIAIVQRMAAEQGVDLTDEMATDVIRGLYYQFRSGGAQQHYALDVVGGSPAAETVESMMKDVPGMRHTSPIQDVAQAYKEHGAKVLSPIHTAGVASDTDIFALAAAGRNISGQVEDLNRISPFIAYLRQGVDPMEAMRRVEHTQVNYSAGGRSGLTPFERKYMKRIVPFYSFSSRMLEWHLKELARRPGGKLAQTTRAANRAQTAIGENEGPLPAHIAQSIAIPGVFKPPKEGMVSYLTGLGGLPLEDTFGLIRPGATVLDTLKGTGQELIGRTSPYLKVPLELATGTQFFTGRKLEDLTPNLGVISKNIGLTEDIPNISPLVEQVASSMPATFGGSRGLTMARQLTDLLQPKEERRRTPLETLLQMTTGVRSTTIDPKKAANIAAREHLETKLRPHPAIHAMREHLFFPEPDRLSPQTQKDAALYKRLSSDAIKAAAKKKKASQIDPLARTLSLGSF